MLSTHRCAILFRQAMLAHWRDSLQLICVRCGDLFYRFEIDEPEISHFFNVRWSGTRFDPVNVDSLHHLCHTGPNGWEYLKHSKYRIYMIRKLGEDGLYQLGQKAHAPMSLDTAKAEFIEKLRGGTLFANLSPPPRSESER